MIVLHWRVTKYVQYVCVCACVCVRMAVCSKCIHAYNIPEISYLFWQESLGMHSMCVSVCVRYAHTHIE